MKVRAKVTKIHPPLPNIINKNGALRLVKRYSIKLMKSENRMGDNMVIDLIVPPEKELPTVKMGSIYVFYINFRVNKKNGVYTNIITSYNFVQGEFMRDGDLCYNPYMTYRKKKFYGKEEHDDIGNPELPIKL